MRNDIVSLLNIFPIVQVFHVNACNAVVAAPTRRIISEMTIDAKPRTLVFQEANGSGLGGFPGFVVQYQRHQSSPLGKQYDRAFVHIRILSKNLISVILREFVSIHLLRTSPAHSAGRLSILPENHYTPV